MILQQILRFIQGYDTIVCVADEEEGRLHGKVVQVLADAGIRGWGMHHAADGTLVFCVSRGDTKRLRSLSVSDVLTLHNRHGLPQLCMRYRRRAGIPIGAILFCLALLYFSQILWRVEITGLSNLSAEQVEKELAELGCEAGAWLPGMDLYAVSDRLLVLDSALSYASVVRNGTTLSVHVREKESVSLQTEKKPANLIAQKDGFVVSFVVKEGQPMVKVGQAVRAGELLVSGIVLHRGGRLSVVCAEGAVYARTTCTATVEIPLSQTVQTEVGRTVIDRAVKIFSWDINFFKSTGNIDTECGTITEKKQVALTERTHLPVWQMTTYVPIYREETRTYTPAQAVRLAMSRAQAQVRAEMGDAEVLTASTVTEQTESGYRVTYTVDCMMDITAQREIGVSP